MRTRDTLAVTAAALAIVPLLAFGLQDTEPEFEPPCLLDDGCVEVYARDSAALRDALEGAQPGIPDGYVLVSRDGRAWWEPVEDACEVGK